MQFVSKVDILKERLTFGDKEEKLEALKSVDQENALALFEQISKLTYHINVQIRVSALHALKFVDQSLLVTIIRDNIRDENKEVRQAASLLFHMHDLAA